MSRRPVRQLLADMLERIERIEEFVTGLDRDAFLGDVKTADAVVRNLEVFGEAANRLPVDFQDRHPEVPWRQIVGLRNRIVHAYFDVDLELVWTIARGELPTLKLVLASLQAEADHTPDVS
jgi:uncharacterized protein with HEPN domain